MTGLVTMLKLHLRTRRKSLTLIVLGLAALVVSTARGISGLYPTQAERLQYEASLGSSPASAALNSRGYDLNTLGGITAYEVGFMGQLVFPLVGLMLAVSLTRGQEEQGRTELLTAGRVSPLAPWAAAVCVVTVVFATFVGLTTAGLAAVDYPAAGSARYSLTLGLFGLAWAGVGLLLGQLCQGARTANTLGFAASLMSYLVRAVIDGRDADAAWATPHGWVAESRPWSANPQVWPWLALLGLFTVSACVAGILARSRDLGDGLVGRTAGPAGAGRRLASPAQLTWRLTRGSALGWLLGAVVWSAALGSLAEEMQTLVRANPTLSEALGLSDPSQLTATFALVLTAVMACAVAVSGFQRLAAEERSGRLGLVLAGRFSRLRLFGQWALVVAVEVAAVLLAGSVALGVSQALVRDDAPAWTTAVGDGMAYLTPALLVWAGSGLLFAASSRLLGLGWLVVGWATLVALLGETLELPQWARNLSPLDHVGLVPMTEARTAGIAALGICAAVSLALAALWSRRRDLAAG